MGEDKSDKERAFDHLLSKQKKYVFITKNILEVNKKKNKK